MNLNKYRRELRVQRKEVLLNKIFQSKKDKSPLEIIIETENNRKVKENVAKEIGRIGKITHQFKVIPYISIICTGEDAEQIANKIYRKDVNRIFEKSFRHTLNAMKSVDLSNKFSIIPVKKDSRAYFRPKENLWNLENIGAYEAHNKSKGNGIKIAVIDTGVDYNHNEVSRNFTRNKGYNFIKDNDSPFDDYGHGTHVAGIAAGKNCGVAPDATLYAVKVLDSDGSGSDATVAAGIEWALLNNIDVANMSLGSPVASRALEDMCRIAWQKGLLLVAAAGNDGYGPEYPAAFGDYVIAVAAVDRDNKHADFSNIWETNDISAPGVGIYSCYPGGGYRVWDGTSMATPHVSGALGLMISKTGKTNLVEEIMYETAKRLEYNGEYENEWVFGAGLVRADNMLENAYYKRKIGEILRRKYNHNNALKKARKIAWKIIW
ncbi:MAG: S8 family peptidase [Nanoarchaeota archaeon]|nr:S8 family peptidase [Nanoarchaeota archaeon]MBU4493033.1 S8 family peptidase [Nanoarchaeota archaeon]